MVRQNENDVRCDERESNLAHADGMRPRFPPPPPCSGVVEKKGKRGKGILEEREIGSLQ